MKRFFVHGIGVHAALAAALIATACSDSSGPADPDSGNLVANGATSMQPVPGGDAQSASVGSAVAVAPAVVLKDNTGAPVAGARVSFTASGSGSVQNSSVVTGADGVASSGQWTLGSAGGQVLEAKSGKLTVRFTATAVDGFNIVVRYIGAPNARQRLALTNAVNRWQAVITRDLVNIPMNAERGACFPEQPSLSETVDDLLMFVEFVDIDGVGNVLGQAGPCFVRSDNLLPVVGHLKLDAADLDWMAQRGTLDDVVLHEVGHVLGFGTLWGDKKVLTGAGTDDPRFTGGAALAAYRALGGTDAWVAVENTGSAGTRDGHWRETIFGNELMTGYINNSPNPMSALTIASLTDIGYGTNPGAASSYTIGKPTSGSIVLDIAKHERLTKPKFKVDRQGKKTKFGRE